MKEETTQSVADYLFENLQEDELLYAVLDGASIDDLLDHLYVEEPPEFECVFQGDLEPDIAEVAPYLVLLKPETEFSDWILSEGWGKHWGVFAVSNLDLGAMLRQFRKFVNVHDPDGKPLLFRYYDPRVLRVYLPTCNAEELGMLFGPIHRYLLEGEDPKTILRFRNQSGALEVEKLPLAST